MVAYGTPSLGLQIYYHLFLKEESGISHITNQTIFLHSLKHTHTYTTRTMLTFELMLFDVWTYETIGDIPITSSSKLGQN